MIIRKVFLLLLIGLVSACSLTVENETERIEYPEVEKVELDRSATDQAKTLTDLGLAYYQLEKYNYALEYLERALELDNTNGVTYQVIALINERSNKPEQAQLYYNKALKVAPEDYDIITSYGVFLYQQARYDEALIELNKVADAPFYKKKWVAYTYLGYYDLKSAQLRQAEKRFFYALKMNKSYAPALIEMAKIRYQKGDMMSARAFIERYFGQVEKTPESLHLAIKIETALQSYDSAEAYKLELKRNFPFAE